MTKSDQYKTIGLVLTIIGGFIVGSSIATHPGMVTFIVGPALAFIEIARSLPPEGYVVIGLAVMAVGITFGAMADVMEDDD